MRTVTVSHNWYSFPRCSGIAVPTVFGAPSDVSCRDQGRACQAWSGLVGMEAELGHSLTWTRRRDPSFFFTKKTGAPTGDLEGHIRPLARFS